MQKTPSQKAVDIATRIVGLLQTKTDEPAKTEQAIYDLIDDALIEAARRPYYSTPALWNRIQPALVTTLVTIKNIAPLLLALMLGLFLLIFIFAAFFPTESPPSYHPQPQWKRMLNMSSAAPPTSPNTFVESIAAAWTTTFPSAVTKKPARVRRSTGFAHIPPPTPSELQRIHYAEQPMSAVVPCCTQESAPDDYCFVCEGVTDLS